MSRATAAPASPSAAPETPTTPAALPVRRGLIYLALAGTAWGTTGAAVDLVYRSSDLGPAAISFWRLVGALTVLLAVRTLRRPGRASAVPAPVVPAPVDPAPVDPAPADRRERNLEPNRVWNRGRVLLLGGTGIGMAVFQVAYFAAVQDTGLAVGTVRKAVGVLIDEGLAYTVPGRGTFAAART